MSPPEETRRSGVQIGIVKDAKLVAVNCNVKVRLSRSGESEYVLRMSVLLSAAHPNQQPHNQDQLSAASKGKMQSETMSQTTPSTEIDTQQATSPITTNRAPNPEATLPALPIEMLQQIAGYTTTRADLKALRLTCRDIADKTEEAYARRLFGQQAYFLNCLESLEIGLSISKHPVFAPEIKEICFLVEDVQHLRDPQHPRSFQKPITARENNERGRALQNLLSNLKAIGKLETIRVVDMGYKGPRPVKMPDVDWRAKYRDWKCWGIMKASPVRMLANAVPSDMKLVTFSTNALKWTPSVPTFVYCPLFESLQHLRLDVSKDDISSGLVEGISGSRLPPAARRLKTLELKVHGFHLFGPSSTTPSLVQLLIRETMPCLEFLELERW